MELKETESAVFLCRLEGDGICRTIVKPDAEILLSHAIENTENVSRLFSGVPGPLFVDLRKIKSMSKEARDHFSMRGRTAKVNAIGLLIKSPVSRVIGNFYMLFSKPSTPTKLFTEEKNAIAWLKQFV
jgi:hypothetical protein